MTTDQKHYLLNAPKMCRSDTCRASPVPQKEPNRDHWLPIGILRRCLTEIGVTKLVTAIFGLNQNVEPTRLSCNQEHPKWLPETTTDNLRSVSLNTLSYRPYLVRDKLKPRHLKPISGTRKHVSLVDRILGRDQRTETLKIGLREINPLQVPGQFRRFLAHVNLSLNYFRPAVLDPLETFQVIRAITTDYQVTLIGTCRDYKIRTSRPILLVITSTTGDVRYWFLRPGAKSKRRPPIIKDNYFPGETKAEVQEEKNEEKELHISQVQISQAQEKKELPVSQVQVIQKVQPVEQQPSPSPSPLYLPKSYQRQQSNPFQTPHSTHLLGQQPSPFLSNATPISQNLQFIGSQPVLLQQPSPFQRQRSAPQPNPIPLHRQAPALLQVGQPQPSPSPSPNPFQRRQSNPSQPTSIQNPSPFQQASPSPFQRRQSNPSHPTSIQNPSRSPFQAPQNPFQQPSPSPSPSPNPFQRLERPVQPSPFQQPSPSPFQRSQAIPTQIPFQPPQPIPSPSPNPFQPPQTKPSNPFQRR